MKCKWCKKEFKEKNGCWYGDRQIACSELCAHGLSLKEEVWDLRNNMALIKAKLAKKASEMLGLKVNISILEDWHEE